MKITLLTLLLSTFTLFNHVQAQITEWQSISNFPGTARGSVSSFVIGDTAYVGLGHANGTYYDDFYKYDVENDVWTPINDFPGAARSSAVAFVSNGKAYVGTGYDADNSFADFYEYDPATSNWQSIASIPTERSSASSFVINNIGYVGLGSGASEQLSNFYKYDSTLDQWDPIAGIGTDNKRMNAIGFSSNGKGFITSGNDGSFTFSDLRSYDPNSDTWNEEIFATYNLSSLSKNSVYQDENGFVHILKTGGEEVIIDLSDNSTTSEASYFTDERSSPIVLKINDEIISGLGYTGFVFDIEYQGTFQKLVTIEPPIAPSLNDNYSWGKNTTDGEYTYISWTNNESGNFDGNIIYLSNGDNTNYRPIDTVWYSQTYFYIPNSEVDINTKHYVKVAAYKGVQAVSSNEISFYPVFREGQINTPV
ncbi:kelch repeat-containing protein [Marivirga arenosa]|uniref:Kelch repeat-containing protein n=1 Tax=Marivirga arenosa TaxID=3059076 RepID=A0AA51RD52_9BACT|nr:kelch repeat-containing protein [Marivirga sp. ABR2-2]WMN06650.1 kelch repeat-containing protein [Marivirga sp. ABR2-2]